MSALAVAPVTTALTTKELWNKSLREARKAGLSVKQNVRECCRGCVDVVEVMGLKDEDNDAWAYTYGGQGMATKWQDDRMIPAYTPRYARRNQNVDEVYFNHGNGAGAILVKAFRANGFTVKWDGTESQCVMVNPTI